MQISIPLNFESVDSSIINKLQSFCEKYLFLYSTLNKANMYPKTYTCFLEGYVEMAYIAASNKLINRDKLAEILDIPVPRAKELLEKYNKEQNTKQRVIKRELDNLTGGLVYHSESSYPIEVEVIVPCTLNNLDFSQYKRSDYEEFFLPLTKEEKWFEASELESARKFLALYNYLESKLRNLCVYQRSLNNTEKSTEVIVCGESYNLVVLLKTKAIYS